MMDSECRSNRATLCRTSIIYLAGMAENVATIRIKPSNIHWKDGINKLYWVEDKGERIPFSASWCSNWWLPASSSNVIKESGPWPQSGPFEPLMSFVDSEKEA